MTDQAAGPGPATRGSALGLRLALAFITVALAAVALLAGLTAAFAAADVSTLAGQQRAELAGAIASAAGAAWEGNRTWSAADLSPVLDLAARTGAAVQIRDQAGQVIGSSPAFATAHGPQSSPPVAARGQRVGTAVVRFTGSGLSAADAVLQTALLRAIAARPGWRPCSRCSPGSRWPGGSPARSPG